MPHDPFKARDTIQTPLGDRVVYKLDACRGIGEIETLPYSIRVLLEACLRNHDGFVIDDEHVKAIAGYDATGTSATPRSPSSPAASCSRTSPACPPWSTSPPCGPASSA